MSRSRSRPIPPTALLLLSIVSFQLGATVAKGLFPLIGSEATVFLRLAFGALMLLAVWRPRLGGRARADYLTVILFGLILACMNLAFYASLARIPLGLAVTVEFVGPLSVAVAGSRRRLDVALAACAAAGILLLAPVGVHHVDALGLTLALLAGGLWAAYILVAKRLGRAWSGGGGVAVAMGLGAIVLLPFGVQAVGAGAMVQTPRILLTGAGIGLLSAALPFSLEFEALRRMPARVYGILVSVEPVVAALAGFVFLHQTVGARGLGAMALVTIASIGSARSRHVAAPPADAR